MASLPAMNVYRKFAYWLVILVAVGFAAARLAWRNAAPTRARSTVVVSIGSTAVVAEVAATPLARQRGLSGRASLPEGQGMLFVFSPPDRPLFGMRAMRFPLDFIWIFQGKITAVTPNVAPPSDRQPLASYQPKDVVDAVLEVPAGFSQRHQLRRGDSVKW